MPTFTVHPVSDKWTIKEDGSKTTGTTVYRVLSDAPTTAERARYADGVPLRGSVYPGAPEGSALKCRGRSGVADGQSRLNFLITLDYDDTNTFAANPLLEPATFTHDEETSDEEYFKDCTPSDAGGPKYAQTTATEPFPNLPKRETSSAVIKMTRNVASTTTFAAFRAMRNKVNQSPVTIDSETYDAGTVRVRKPELTEVKTRDGYSYRELSAELVINENGWEQKYESRGLIELDEDGIPWPITGEDGGPVKNPWPLDADGMAKESVDDEGAEIVLRPYAYADISGLFA